MVEKYSPEHRGQGDANTIYIPSGFGTRDLSSTIHSDLNSVAPNSASQNDVSLAEGMHPPDSPVSGLGHYFQDCRRHIDRNIGITRQ
jgi:hypothetical protein